NSFSLLGGLVERAEPADPRKEPPNGMVRGVLVRTGKPDGKRFQYIFNLPEETGPGPEIRENLMKSFIAAMRDAGPPQHGDPNPKSILNGDSVKEWCPVFYLDENNQVKYFGWTMMFRLAYGHDQANWPLRSVQDFVP